MKNLIKSTLSHPIYQYSPSESYLNTAFWGPDPLVSFLNQHLIDFCEEQFGTTGFIVASVVGSAMKVIGLLSTFVFFAMLSPIWIPTACRSCSEIDETNLNPNDYEDPVFRVFKEGEEVLSIEVIN